MAEYSISERLKKVALAPAAPIAWGFFAPDIERVTHTPFAALTLSDLGWPLLWLLALPFVLRWSVDLVYEAVTGRDSVWLWHP